MSSVCFDVPMMSELGTNRTLTINPTFQKSCNSLLEWKNTLIKRIHIEFQGPLQEIRQDAANVSYANADEAHSVQARCVKRSARHNYIT